ncbi:MAG: hypothetical protein ACOZBH_02095 [Patescibacteria group bacterium]
MKKIEISEISKVIPGIFFSAERTLIVADGQELAVVMSINDFRELIEAKRSRTMDFDSLSREKN